MRVAVSTRGSHSSRALALLVATLASFVLTIAAGYSATRSAIEGSRWATHADDVKLALDEWMLAVGRGDVQTVREAEAKVQRLTADDPRQRESFARAEALSQRGDGAELRDLLQSMQNEQDQLVRERLQRARGARARSMSGFVAGASLTLLFGAGAFAALRLQLMRRLATEERLHASEERFHRLVDAVTDYAIFMLDETGDVTTWNAGAKKTKGYEADEIIGKHFSVFYTPEDRAAGRPDQILERVRRTGHSEDESWRVRKDGSRFWANVVITALYNQKGVITGFAKVTRDLTARRAAEVNERRLLREQLAHAASEDAREEMERVNRAKDEFLATMSHELRTPLNAISGWTTILRKKPRDESKVDRGLEVIERNVKAQTRLVGDLLDVSRIMSGKLHLTLKKTEVLPVIVAAADVNRSAAEAKGVRLVVDVDPQIGATSADADRLQQILWNLLSNAVRFTPRGGRVTVTGDRVGSGIVIRVQDTGLGIAPEHLPHVFERFMQVDTSTTRTHGGLGLGLAIVRHLVEAHGGTVQAQSEGIGHGATFIVTFPVHATAHPRTETGALGPGDAQAGAEPSPLAPPSLKDVHVLVVDDDEDSLDLLRMVLESAGANVTTASSARQALDALDSRKPFELIISDIGMPEMDGYSLIRRIRSNKSSAELPAIALTAFARSDDAERAKRSGYQDHLAKPISEGRLLQAVKTWSRARPDSALDRPT